MKKLTIPAGIARRFEKNLLKMKLTATLFFVSLVAMSATSYSQSTRFDITMSGKNIIELFKEIEAKGNFYFFYQKEELKDLNSVTVSRKNANVIEILDEVLEGTGLAYKVIDRYVIVTRSENLGEMERATVTQQQNAVSGRVTDRLGAPLPGVTVVVKGTTTGTITDNNGSYILSNVTPSSVLVYSFVGMRTQEVVVGNQASINITMEEETVGIEEVVAIGYGTQKRGNLTGSVASVNSDKLTIAPLASTANALAGRLPGLISKQISGMPGSDAAQISIRGFGSALVIVDGVESSFNNIDVNQIESISILKDGAASIYGARAGNGVVLVTTKRGQDQKPTITVNTSYTGQGVTSILHPASSGERSEMEREAHMQSGKPEANAPWKADEVAKFFAGNDPAYINTNWYDHVFRDWAPQQNHNISLRGGSEKIKYFGFFGYTKQETMIKRKGGDYTRYNAQSNIDATITKNLSMTIDMTMAYENRLFPIRGLQNDGYLWQDYYTTRPWYPASFPDPSKIPWGGIDVGSIATVSNIDLMGFNLDKRQNFRGVATLTYDFARIPGLRAKAFVNYSDNVVYTKNFRKPINFYTFNAGNDTYSVAASFNESNLGESFNKSNMLTQQYSLNYENTFNEIHRLSALALFESIDYRSNYISAFRSNLLTPAIEQLFIGSTTGMGNNGAASEMGRVSYVSRINYSLMDRYLIETIMRADASAKFPSDKRWGYFPSVSLGWIVTQEGFMEDVSQIDNLKIRASYGQSGNDAVGNFQYLSGYSLRGSAILDNAAQPGLFVTGLANPLLTWERMTIYNAGLDFSFFKQKIYGSGDLFYRERSGIPATRINSLPGTFGSSLPPENLNSLDDRGFELSLGTTGKVGDFDYDISGNISWSRAKWIHYEEPDYVDPDQKRISQQTGYWTDRAMGYVSDGLFTSQDEINALEYVYSGLGGNASLRPGDVKYLDLNGDNILDWKDQKEIGKGTFPHWMYGFNTTFKYKNFDLITLFQGAFGYNTRISLTQYFNKVQYELRWTEQSNDPDALVARLGGASSNGYTSDYLYKPTSYIRLKSASFGYEVSEQILNKLGVDKLRIFVAGTNLLTLSSLSKYKLDPETPSGTIMVYPQQRTISVGLNLSF
jgi:TonB-linked SusC/RagA family outer membrane protein